MLGSTPPAAIVTATRRGSSGARVRHQLRCAGRARGARARRRAAGGSAARGGARKNTHPCPAAWTAPRRCGWPAGCGAARCCDAEPAGGAARRAVSAPRGGQPKCGGAGRSTQHRPLHPAREHAPRLLVVAAGVARQLEHLGGQVLQHGGQVHRRAGADAGGVLARLEVARHAAHGELEARLGGAAHSLLGGLSLAAARHGVGVWGGGEERRRVWRAARGARAARRVGALSRR